MALSKKKKILVVKLGAPGDVVRTTTILPYLKGDVFWLTSHINQDLLLKAPNVKEILFFDCNHCREKLLGMHFDLVLGLDEDLDVTRFVTKLKKKKTIGMYYDPKKKRNMYTPTSRIWFDKGLYSRLGRKVADELKKKNTKTYQEMLFSMLGLKFKNQPSQLGVKPNPSPKFDVGLEIRAGERWPTKKWGRYSELKRKLLKDGLKVFEFKERPTLREYMDDINNCRVVVCGDTLAMHLGLALQKRVVSIFCSTPPQDHHDYGLMKKLYPAEAPCFVSFKAKCGHSPQCIDRVSVQTVYECTKQALREA